MIPSFVKRLSSSLSFGSGSGSKSPGRGERGKQENGPSQGSSSSNNNGAVDYEEITALRRQSTHELPAGTGTETDAVRRKSSRSNAVASVREATKQLSRRSTKSISSVQSVRTEVTKTFSKSSSKLSVVPRLSRKETSKASLPSEAGGSSKKSSSLAKKGPLTKKASASQKNAAPVAPAVRKASVTKTDPRLWFPRGSILAVRTQNAQEFFLCRARKNIFNFTKEAPVNWLQTKRGSHLNENCYKTTYADSIDPASILMQVNMEKKSRLTHFLPPEEKLAICHLLKQVEDVEGGKISVDDVDDDVAEVVQIEEPPPKKPKIVKSASQKLREKAVKQALKKKTSGAKAEKPKQKRAAKKKGEAEPKRKKAVKKVNELELHPRPDIKVLDKDPLFETDANMPYVSKRANSRLVFRAIYLKDNKMLGKLLKDGNRMRDLLYKSLDNDDSPMKAAVEVGDAAVFKTLLHEYSGDKYESRLKDNDYETNMLEKLDNGSYNQRSLGIRFIRKLQASRGNREGNNAFLATEEVPRFSLSDLLLWGMSDALLKVWKNFKQKKGEEKSWTDAVSTRHFQFFLMAGDHKRAGKLVEEDLKLGCSGFNNLFRDVLLFEKEDLTNCSPSNVTQVNKRVFKLSPVHCAAVNPNVKYLEKLLSVVPDVHMTDTTGRRPIHFAACCSSTAPLELLLGWGGNPNDTDSQRNIPLHYAVKANRPDNVQLLFKHASANAGQDMLSGKYGVGGVNRPTKTSHTPLHLAVLRDKIEMAKVLLANGANVNAKLNVAMMQITPLMFAAQRGNLKMVRLLVEKGAVVEQKDRLGRTALIHACKNGATKVLSYFLHIGANGERGDHSDNTPLHYAAAFGWLFTVRFLLEAGVDPNASNMWKVTPVSVAYLKAQNGIVRELLNSDKVDINFPDDNGLTLVFRGCQSDLRQKDLEAQIKYLVEERGALCTTKDNDGRNPLHHLALNRTATDKNVKEAVSQSIKMAELLIKHGCKVTDVDEDGFTPAMLALGMNLNLPLAEFLLKSGSPVLAPPDGDPDRSVLHLLATNLWTKEGNPYQVQALCRKFKFDEEVDKMLQYVDSDGYTPLQLSVVSLKEAPCRVFSDLEEHRAAKLLQKKQWDNFHEYIKALIPASDLNAVVGKKFFAIDDMPKPDSTNWYEDIHHAGKSAAHLSLLLDDPTFDTKGNIVDRNSGYLFKMLVSAGTNVNVRDIGGRTVLNTVISKNRINVIPFLVKEAKCDVNLPDLEKTASGRSKVHPIIQASSNIAFPALLALAEFDKFDISASQKETGSSSLHILVKDHYRYLFQILQVLEKFAKRGYNFNAVDNRKRTIMHYAIRQNKGTLNESFELEVKLLQLGVDLSLQDDRGRTPFHYVFKKKNRGYRNYGSRSDAQDPAELAKLLGRNMTKEEINIKDNDGKTALHFAASNGAGICCMYLIMIGADFNVEDRDGNTPLALAILNKHDGCATTLIQSGSDLLSEVKVVSDSLKKKRKNQEKARKEKLGKASRPANKRRDSNDSEDDDDNDSDDDDGSDSGSDEKSDEEEEMSGEGDSDDGNLELGTKLMWRPLRDVQDKKDIEKIPIYQAAVTSDLNGVAMFVTEADSDRSGLTQLDAINIAINNCKYNTALRLVCTTTDLKVLKHVDDKGRNLLHVLALSCENNSKTSDGAINKIAEVLINSGVPVDVPDDYRCSPILYAVLNRHFNLADFLAEKSGGYKVKYTDGFGRGYLAAALWRSYSKGIDSNTWSFIERLIGKKLNVNQHFDLPVGEQWIRHNKTVDPNYWMSYRDHKITALILSIHIEDFDISHNFLQFGADPNLSDGNNLTPLMHAVVLNLKNHVKQLLNYEYDPKCPKNFTGLKEHETPAAEPKKGGKKLNPSVFNIVSVDNEASDDESEEEEEEMDVEDEDETSATSSAGEDFLPVKKTSQVKLDVKNKENQTALHLVARPKPEGTYDNEEIAFVLIKAGAKQTFDRQGQTPFDLALKSGAVKVACRLRSLYELPSKTMKVQYKRDFKVTDGVPPSKEKLTDFMEAADKVLQRFDSSQMVVEDKYVHEIDENCNVTNGELVKDEELDMYYDVLLTKVDVNRGEWGLYNFYQLQLVFQPGKKLYVLFTRWGRIEDSGQFQHTPFTDRETAVKEFMKIFREKTGNTWPEVKNFEQKPRKYRLVEDVARKAPPAQKDVDITLESSCKSVLPNQLHFVIKTMMNPKKMQLSMKATRGLSTDCLPFGQLNKERLMQGKRILEEIEKLVDQVEKYRKSHNRHDEVDPEEKAKYKEHLEKIDTLSNEYFHVVPQKNFSCEKLRPLDQRQRLMQQIQNLSNLLDYEVACKMLLGAMANRKVYNPVDYVYRCLDCKLELLSSDDPMMERILCYIWFSDKGNSTVQAIYKVAREGEDERFRAKEPQNRRFLWHGTSNSNLLSILRRGLLVAPAEARKTGWRFGKGIYFSDQFVKSKGYVARATTNFMLLCEVELGEVHTFDNKKSAEDQEDAMAKSDSVIAVGYSCAENWFFLRSGVKIPEKRGTTSNYFDYSSDNTEYIVKDPAQVCIRYLIQYK
ncbi:poly [ADP-ribose] polymerase tankyrase [Aplysia californica]|uniref:Poly [ADP-ribose] polymerase n=1 Tax=Aplysia californica TaxID=6500 RepID=A0ABM1A4Y0_APLCA|nr:poly [ADP-ribose] polymerase tankyrase [Aplysia californica]